jgi:hypothetical protein
MSPPIRYGLADEHLGRITPQADGHLVMWSDYAALAADYVEVKDLYLKSRVDIGNLKAEVERLNDLANDPYRLSKGWRPIETAPMDGTDILCFCVEPEFEGEENPWTEFRVCFYGVLTEGESCWMSHYGYEQHPTHWMPLPNPPAAKEGRDAK